MPDSLKLLSLNQTEARKPCNRGRVDYFARRPGIASWCRPNPISGNADATGRLGNPFHADHDFLYNFRGGLSV